MDNYEQGKMNCPKCNKEMRILFPSLSDIRLVYKQIKNAYWRCDNCYLELTKEGKDE